MNPALLALDLGALPIIVKSVGRLLSIQIDAKNNLVECAIIVIDLDG
jgi:hypothetical protein